MSTENLQAPITGQFRSSPFYVALGAPLLASLLSIGLTALTYRVLREDVARDLLAQINPMLLLAGGGGGIGGALGMVKRGLDITQGKIRVQAPPQMPENLTIGTAVNNAPVPPVQSASAPPTPFISEPEPVKAEEEFN